MTLPTVFLSYSRQDREYAAAIAAALKRAQLNVWWDRALNVGDEFPNEIELQVKSAACVVVLWTASSVTSRWVRAEATIGANRGVLIPLLVDGTRPPLEFINIQTLDVTAWLRDGSPELEQTLVSSVSRRLSAEREAATIPPDRTSQLQTQLLAGPSTHELKEGMYELEAIAKGQPSNVRARMLLDDYRLALSRDEVMYSRSGNIELYQLSSVRTWRILVWALFYVLAAGGIAHQAFGLNLLQSVLAAVGLPVAVWLFFVVLAGAMNLWEWLRGLLGRGGG